ncbi:hypothetical protein TRFO_35628 [Tritrichomonas foetus]|uniref:DH domain-containing protein n=1 Tax=Tritrichomonas foetus TaxID=1144522 RepID=A0A1J4JFQ8_9EUKA|nr:hypothetical protein TRFO_35628 [Tritrichomonas foetus]|eukprot:OHS98054.1 hypothetical protein TRFO_35628 [Tritrichomonas foetus]
MMHQYILCIFPDSSCRPIRINDDYTFNLSIFLKKWRNESHSLFYVSPSFIQILPEKGLISLPEIFTQDVISYHLQFLPKTFPQYILRIYPICFAIEDGNNRNSSNINDNNINIDEINQGKNCFVADNPYFELNLWNIGFNFNSEFTLKLLQEIFSTSFCVDYESLSFHVESSKDNISMDLPIFSQRNILKTSKLYMYVKMQIASMKCAKQREKNIKEIKVTELNYVNELELVSKLFNEAFFEGLNISKDIYCRTFKSISDIKPIHEEFLKSLNEAGNTVESSIGQTFLKFNPMFKISLPHICNFAAANEEINELLTTNKNFSMETSKILKNYFDGKPLNSILVTPIQRLPRYPLLLRDLLKVTSKNHWDYSNIKHAYGEIQLIVKTMDDKKQESD